MIRTLAQVDRINSLMAIKASQSIEAIRALHLGISKAEAREIERDLFYEERTARGACVIKPSLDLG